MADGFTLSGDRKLIVSALGALPDESIRRPFATLLPAFSASERHQAEAMTTKLVDMGCVEFCCVGPESEQLHDALDEVIEARGVLGVVTTWHVDVLDACEHFLYAAGGERATLLALIAAHPSVEAKLKEEARR